MDAYGLKTMYQLQASIGVSKSGDPSPTWTYATLAEGIDNVAEAMNEIVQQYQFLADQGYSRNHVTGAAPAYTFTGRRVFGDTAQDFIFSKKYSLDGDRQSSFKLVYTDAKGAESTVTCDCTICNIQEWSGAATEDSAISFEIRLDGAPTVA